MKCSVVGCDTPAVTIFRGFSLCDRCWDVAVEIPEHVPSNYLDSIIMEVIDKTVTGSDSLDDALAHRGFAKPRDN